MEEERILAVNVGNTTTQLGVFGCDGTGAPRLLLARSFTTPAGITPDEARLLVQRVAAEQAGEGVSSGILASVVPALSPSWIDGIETALRRRPLVVGPGLRSGIRLKFDNPAEVGADRIANAVAARAIAGAPALAVDFGTVTTVEAIDKEGAFAGGAIAPGLALSARAMSEAAARLHAIELAVPRRVIGTGTTTALQTGVVLGEAARADGLIDAMARELGADPSDAPVVITGEHAELMRPLLRHACTLDAALTLRGLALIWQENARRAERGRS